jgi:phage-related protein
MPTTRVVFYRDADGSIPVIDWLDKLPKKARDKCLLRLQRLRQLGHELRRPEADFLRDGIYELRVGMSGMNYRMLYFFHQNIAAVVSNGLVKEREVPPIEIERALLRKRLFNTNPSKFTAEVQQ